VAKARDGTCQEAFEGLRGLEATTGNQAVLVETGETFEALATHRALEQAWG
jgi:hypothetical protein